MTAVSFSAKLDQLDLLQSNAFNKMNGVSSGTNVTRMNSIFNNGVLNAGQFRAQLLQNSSIFDIANSQSTQADSAQTGTTQKAGADATSVMLSSLNNLFNIAQNSFNSVLTMVQDAITASTTEASALQSPQTTGPSINPETSLTTDNQGTEEKAGTPTGDTTGMLGGENTITDSGKTEDVEAPKDDIEAPEDQPVDTPKEPETSDAPETSSDIDKTEIEQQEQRRLEEERKKAEEEYNFVEVVA